MPREVRRRLANRHCVSAKGLPLWAFHENFPDWFRGSPKIIVPEVCTRISVLFDLDGTVLPLHSTIAIKVANPNEAKRLTDLLLSDGAWRALRERCPHMVNGAVRLTVPVLRGLLSERLSSAGASLAH